MADFDELDEMPWPSVTSDDEESKPAATISPDIFPTQPPDNGIPPLQLDTQPTSNNQNRRKSSRSSRNNSEEEDQQDQPIKKSRNLHGNQNRRKSSRSSRNNSEEEDQQDQPIKKSRNLRGRRQPALEAMANWKAHTLGIEVTSQLQELYLFPSQRFSCNETDDKHRIEMCKLANNKIALESAKDHLQRELEEAGVVRTKKTSGADKTKRHIELLKKVMDEKGVSNASKFHQMITF